MWLGADHKRGDRNVLWKRGNSGDGGRAGANCASGVQPAVNHTVATGSLPFGTRLLIDGQEYVVEDKGDSNMDAFWIDIYVETHEEGLRRGMYKSDVYIID